MRHKKSGAKLGRTTTHRKAMFKNMASALLTHERISTTEAKAKALRGVVDRLVTLALRNDLHSRRLAYKVLCNHGLVKKLFDEIGPRFVGVPGGFTRVVKLGNRLGDCAPLAIIELSRSATLEAKPAEVAAPAAASETEQEPASN